jgi:hypothetical protein
MRKIVYMVTIHSSNFLKPKKNLLIFKSKTMYYEVSASPSFLEILSFISTHMGKASL